MHGFEIIEHTLTRRDVMHSLVNENATAKKVHAVVFKYLRKKRKQLKFKALRRLGKKIRKVIKKSGRRFFPPVTSVQTA